MATVWNIWLECTTRIFEEQVSKESDICSNIKFLLLSGPFLLNYSDLCQYEYKQQLGSYDLLDHQGSFFEGYVQGIEIANKTWHIFQLFFVHLNFNFQCSSYGVFLFFDW